MARVLFVTSEAYPLIKTGGLADVSASLPTALHTLGDDVRILLPGYQSVMEQARAQGVEPVARLPVGETTVTLWQTPLPGTDVPVWLVDHPNSFARPGNPYVDRTGADWPDNASRFLLFARVAAELATPHTRIAWQPDIVHCNDWQSAMVPALLSLTPERPATVFTIHNLSYRGLFPRSMFETLGLPEHFWHFERLEFHGELAFIKGGLVYADRITTVSPSYAREILTPEQGVGLDGLLRHRADDLSGILNGIDSRIWNPATDTHLTAQFDRTDLSGKAANKTALQKALGLSPDPAVPVIGFIGRLVEQKGVDLVLGALPTIIDSGAQLVVLGSGDTLFEEALEEAAQRNPGTVSVTLGYDENLAHRIEAGADLFLMPSRFEPCGLNQMYSQIYGTLPIVRAVGGLRDTVVDLAGDLDNIGNATGFTFQEPTAVALSGAIERALDLYPNKALWRQVQDNGMSRDFSWLNSARAYQALYQGLL